MAAPAPPKTETRKRRRWPWVVGITVVVLAALAAYGIWWFLKDDSPPPPTLAGALAGVSTTEASAETTGAVQTTIEAGVTETTSAGAGTTGTVSSGVDGTWAVDTSLGEFSFDDATGSFVGFRLDEQLQGIGSAQAVGRTPAVEGTITIDGTTLTSADITADLSQLTTNDSRRDSRARGALDTNSFPEATFTLTGPVELSADASGGQPISATATGDLTIKGVTNSVTVALQAQLNGDGTIIAVVGSIPVVFADYGVSVPSSPVVVSASDNGQIELQLLFTKQG